MMNLQGGNRPQKPMKPVLLFVEGSDDKGVLESLVKHLDFEPIIQVMLLQGKDNLRPVLQAVRNTDEFENVPVRSLGIIRDADDDAQSAFQSACDALRKVQFTPPQKSLQIMQDDRNFRTGVMIMPPDKTSGAIEDVFLQSLSDNPLMHCVETYAGCVEQIQGHSVEKPQKMRLQTYLAAVAVGKRLGESAGKKGLWNWKHPEFTPLITFIRELAL